jgi:hypothetical protein
MKARRQVLALLCGVFAAVLAAVGVAWACTPAARLAPLSPRSGPVGTLVTVHGEAFNDGVPVEIRWNSVRGPLMATVTPPRGAFSVEVTIPEAPPRVYAIYAVQQSTADRVGGKGQEAFEVTAPARADERTPEGGASSPEGNAAPGPATASDPEPARADRPPAPARPAATAPGSRAAAAVSPAPANAVTPPPVQALPREESPAAAAPQPAAEPAPAPPVGSVSGDLWAGFASGSQPSLTGPSLVGPPPSTSDGRGLALGVGLLGVGLVSLFAGVMLAEGRRRRVRAEGVRDT